MSKNSLKRKCFLNIQPLPSTFLSGYFVYFLISILYLWHNQTLVQFSCSARPWVDTHSAPGIWQGKSRILWWSSGSGGVCSWKRDLNLVCWALCCSPHKSISFSSIDYKMQFFEYFFLWFNWFSVSESTNHKLLFHIEMFTKQGPWQREYDPRSPICSRHFWGWVFFWMNTFT